MKITNPAFRVNSTEQEFQAILARVRTRANRTVFANKVLDFVFFILLTIVLIATLYVVMHPSHNNMVYGGMFA